MEHIISSADLQVSVIAPLANIAISGNASYLTPTQISTAYNIPANNGANVKVGIISLGGGWIQGDLDKAMGNLGITDYSPITSVFVDDGATNSWTGNINSADAENTLDLYCIFGMVPKADIVMYRGVGTTGTNGGFANVLNRAVNDNCDVISISWLGSELGGDYLASPLANAAAKGITVLVASGDYGSRVHTWSAQGAGYPASNANVIAVGGTELTLYANNTIQSENASSRSGGGISAIIPVPAWQNNIKYTTYPANVTYTLTAGSMTANVNARGVPDISAPFQYYPIWFNGGTNHLMTGTSAACPILAGMIARLKSLTGKNFKSLNSSLYGDANARAFNDLTVGNDASFISTGYYASSSWDPITGLGSPNGQTLLNILAQTTKVKTAANTWSPTANVFVKTATNTWSNVKTIWTKVDSNTWKQSF